MPPETPFDSIPMPARLVERALDLARAEVGLALVHTRRIAVRAVSALLATIVACAFAQLAIVLLVAWPIVAERVPTLNLVLGVGVSVAVALAGGASALLAWAGAGDRKPASTPHASALGGDAEHSATSPSVAPGPVSDTRAVRNVVVSRQSRIDTREEPVAATLAERVSS